MRCASQPSASCDGEMLTEILISGSHSAASRSASEMTCWERRPIRPISSATGMKTSGPITPESAMVPTREDLEADDLAVGKIDLRLEIGNELAVIEAEADALLDLAVGDQRALHPLVEPDRPRQPGRCGRGPWRYPRGAGRPGCGRRPREFVAMPANAPT